ncbi:MAG: ASKHA domain-containing protein [Syntrophobacteraceae bacterium]|nr:ASKHA domain-containing protein [Syntrophobacteraceae bacterium]
MPKVTFNGGKFSVEAEQGETLLSCIRRSGLKAESTCGGRGVCGKCRVSAHGELSPPDEIERKLLEGQEDKVRLACRAKVAGDIAVTLSDSWTRLQSASAFGLREVALESPVKRVVLPEKDSSAVPYAETLPFRLRDPQLLDKIAGWDANSNHASAILFGDEAIDVRFDGKPVLGAAVDVGTTGLSLCLFDLDTGETIGCSSALNPQTAYGGDVITRIEYCRRERDGLSVLRLALIQELGAMLDQTLGQNLGRDQVYLMSAAGNSTMLHILAGVNPLSLALAPFRPAFLKPLVLDAQRFGLPIAPQGRLVLLPGAAAYVGADIIAGLTAIDYRSAPPCTLFIDIGTNGEIVLIEGPDRLVATSCAMGPALEGMNISCGCRAVPGAIDSVTVGDDGELRFTTIGALPPIGICGSGLVDLVAALLCTGAVAPGGAFTTGAGRFSDRLRGDRYFLTENVFISQKDIRQVQLAKGAAITAILTLLGEAGRSVSDLQQITVAGSFGYHLNPESLKRIGLLPQDYSGPVAFVGNSSLSGAALVVRSQEMLRDMERLASIIRVVELGAHPDFSRRFISMLDFPALRR